MLEIMLKMGKEAQQEEIQPFSSWSHYHIYVWAIAPRPLSAT